MKSKVATILCLTTLGHSSHEKPVPSGLKPAEGLRIETEIDGDLYVVNQEFVCGVEIANIDLNADVCVSNATAKNIARLLPTKNRHRTTDVVGGLKRTLLHCRIECGNDSVTEGLPGGLLYLSYVRL